jgi:hypothetical protein
LKGKGIAFRFTMTGDPLTTTTIEASKFNADDVTSNNYAIISAPTGGMGQFFGLTQGDTQ